MVTHSYLVSTNDTWLPANQNCWPVQLRLETWLIKALDKRGAKVTRAHLFDPREGHGVISSQWMGVDIFWPIPPDTELNKTQTVLACGASVKKYGLAEAEGNLGDVPRFDRNGAKPCASPVIVAETARSPGEHLWHR